jgi:hypothetical protein
MELKKHNNELAERMKLLDTSADKYLAKELIELYEDKCRECQEDRLRCATRPDCKDRNFLNALIEIGVQAEDLPSFCYSQYLDQIRRFVLEKRGRALNDRRLPIKDLLSTLDVTSIKHFSTKFRKEWKQFTRAAAGDIVLFAGDDLLFRFDFSRGVVTINPVHYEIRDLEEFKLYVKLFSEHYGLSSTVTDLTLNWWLLSIEVSGVDAAEVRSLAKSSTAKSFESVYSVEKDGAVLIQVEVIPDGGNDPLETGELRDLFEKILKIAS